MKESQKPRALHADSILSILKAHPKWMNLGEIMQLSALHPGQKTELKRALRELSKRGLVKRDGKRFRPAAANAWEELSADLPAKSEPGSARSSQKLAGPRTPMRESDHRGGSPTSRRGTNSERPQNKPYKSSKPSRDDVESLEGIFHAHPDGFGFVHPIDGQHENIFIPRAEAAKVVDGDKVLATVEAGDRGRFQGRILQVVDRRRQFVIGTYVDQGTHAFVEPQDEHLKRIEVLPTQLARNGDTVKVRLGVGAKLLKATGLLRGEVVGSLGHLEDRSIEVLSIAYKHGFHEEFPVDVIEEADVLDITVSKEEAEQPNRKDVRGLSLVTIDGDDARDFDDAIFVELVPGGYRLVVAIADVSHYVKMGSALDDEALNRATSVYMPGRVLPMLPERLSNGICSLKPDEDRLCMVSDMVISGSGTPVRSTFYPAVMRSRARCTYDEVHKVLNGEHVPHRMEFKPLFELANELALILNKMRMKRGAIDFDLPENKVELKEDGAPSHMVRRERQESHRLVEECMLAANESVARFCRENDFPTVHRHHGDPDPDKMATFGQLARVYGFKVGHDAPTSVELNAVLKEMKGHPEARALNQLLLRSMQQAFYSVESTGHYGLAAEDYLHFTSPIRRYPDLLVHRLLKQHWKFEVSRLIDEEQLEQMAAQSSERERAAMQVEREVTSFYSALMLEKRVGEEFAGTVSSLAEHGMFVELDGLYIEGLSRADTFDQGYEFDADHMRAMVGGGRTVRVGDAVRVLLENVNLKRRHIDLRVLQFDKKIHVEEKEIQSAPRTASRTERPKFQPSHETRGRKPKPEPKFETARAAPQRREPVEVAENRDASSGRDRLDRLWKARGKTADVPVQVVNSKGRQEKPNRDAPAKKAHFGSKSKFSSKRR